MTFRILQLSSILNQLRVSLARTKMYAGVNSFSDARIRAHAPTANSAQIKAIQFVPTLRNQTLISRYPLKPW